MTLMSFLLTLACTSSGSVALTETDGSGVDDTGTNDTGEVEPEPNVAAGAYDGELTWFIPEWDWTLCDMKISLEIDDGGEFATDDICVYIGQDGEKYDLEFSIEGAADEDGELDGQITFQSWAMEATTTTSMNSPTTCPVRSTTTRSRLSFSISLTLTTTASRKLSGTSPSSAKLGRPLAERLGQIRPQGSQACVGQCS